MIKTKAQFDFLLELHKEHTTGPNPSDKIKEYAEFRLLDEQAYNKSKSCGEKYRSKKLSDKILLMHNALTSWPSDTIMKLNFASSITGGRAMRDETKEAVALYQSGDYCMSAAAAKAGCFAQSVKTAVVKLKVFDEAAKQYQAML